MKKKILFMIGAIASMALNEEVHGLHVAYDGGKPAIKGNGKRYELGNIGVFNASDEEIVALIVIGKSIYAETNSRKKLVACINGQVTESFKSWARGLI